MHGQPSGSHRLNQSLGTAVLVCVQRGMVRHGCVPAVSVPLTRGGTKSSIPSALPPVSAPELSCALGEVLKALSSETGLLVALSTPPSAHSGAGNSSPCVPGGPGQVTCSGCCHQGGKPCSQRWQAFLTLPWEIPPVFSWGHRGGNKGGSRALLWGPAVPQNKRAFHLHFRIS